MPAVSEAVRQAFMRYNWPGNVRELENACERIAQTCIVRHRPRRLCVGEHPVPGAARSPLEAGGAAALPAVRRGRRFRSTIGCARSRRT